MVPARAPTPGVISTFVPTRAHETALAAYIESGGSAARASVDSGLPLPRLYAAMRTAWWKDRLRAAEFVPMSARDLGEQIQREAGHRAIQLIEQRWDGLELKDLESLSRIGRDLADTEASSMSGGRVHILARINFQALDRATLEALRGGVRDADVIDTEAADSPPTLDAEWEAQE